jgi:hypothetical protein
MAGCSIIDHKQKMIRETLGKFVQKDRHTSAIHGWQNQIARFSIKRADSPIGIGILSNNLLWDNRSDAFGCPTPARIIYPAKPGFILEKNFERLAYSLGLFFSFFNQSWPFFLKAA